MSTGINLSKFSSTNVEVSKPFKTGIFMGFGFIAAQFILAAAVGLLFIVAPGLLALILGLWAGAK